MYSERSSRMKLLFKQTKSRNRSISDGDTYSNGISCVFSTVSRLVAGIRIPMSIPCVLRVCISADTVSLSKILFGTRDTRIEGVLGMFWGYIHVKLHLGKYVSEY